MTGDPDGAIAAGQQALELAAALGDSALQGQASYHLGQIYYALGDFGRAAELLRWNVEAADRASGTPSTDVRIESRAWLARTLSALGAFAEGRRHGEEALRLATLEGRGHDTDHCPRLPRPAVPRPRGPGARHPGVGPGPGPLSCLRRPELVASDRGGPGLCLCAPGAPRGGARAGGGGDHAKVSARAGWDVVRTGRTAQRGLSSGARNAGRGARAAPAWRRPCPRRPLPMSHRPKPTTSRPWPWPRNSACARSWPTATTGWAGLPPDRPAEEARAALTTAIDLYRAMDMTFWLPQAEAVLAQGK